MQYLRYLRYFFSFRVIAAFALLWLLFMAQAKAWNQFNYNYPVAYQSTGYNENFRPYPGYYTNRYAPAASVQAPYTTASDDNTRDTSNLSLKERAKQKLKAVGDNISEKKRVFMEKLLPYIERENARIRQIREQAAQIIHDLENRYSIPEKSREWLRQLGEKYRVDGDPLEDQEARLELMQRVDIIPASLTLAQAANESAWGKSRFATQANNLFGIWTYDESKGLVPEKRDDSKKHLVRKFDDLGGSVRYYIHMLNSHPAYQKLREVRFEARQNRQDPNGHEMAAGLDKYSAKGELYVKLIRDLIRQNQWAVLDQNEQSA